MALDRTALHQLLEKLVGLFRAGDDEQAGGVSVEPVDDPRPILLSARRAADEAVDERAAPVAGSRMDDDPGRLVDHEQMLVLVGNPEIDLFALERLRRFRWQLHLELLAALESMALRAGAPVYAHQTGRQQALGRGARADLRQLGEEPVEAAARRLLRNARVERLQPAAAAFASVAEATARRGGRGRRGR